MATSLYDLTVSNYLQILDALGPILEKTRDYCAEKDIAPNTLLELRLADDMYPLAFQLHMARHQSLGVIEGLRAGSFSPPKNLETLDYEGFRQMLSDCAASLRALEPADVESLAGGSIDFVFGENRIPFTTENFVMSFSLPNFYFHTTAVYAILRHQGVPLGKRDYLGAMRISR